MANDGEDEAEIDCSDALKLFTQGQRALLLAGIHCFLPKAGPPYQESSTHRTSNILSKLSISATHLRDWQARRELLNRGTVSTRMIR